MSGSIRGKVDVLINAGLGTRNTQEFFKGLYDFLASHPNVDLVARNSGLASNAGDVGYWDESGPFTENAWAVFRMRETLERPYPVYLQIQWAGSTFGLSPGSPGSLNGITDSTAVGIQVAIGMGGDQNPWAGTQTAGAVNDTRANPVWKNPAGGTDSYVYPRTNNAGGSFSASRASFTTISQPSSITARYNILADDDTLIILMDPGDASAWRLYYAGIYDAHPSTGIQRAFCSFGSWQNTIPITAGSTFGLPTGTGAQGGLIHAFAGVRGMMVDRMASMLTSTLQPENLVNDDSGFSMFPEHGVALASAEANLLGQSSSGFAGKTGFYREVCNVGSGDSSADFLRAAFGSSTTTAIKVTVPWSGLAAPKSTSTRTGVSFVRDRVSSDDPIVV